MTEPLCCSVCLEPFNSKSTHRGRALLNCCNHLVCVSCIKAILKKTQFYSTTTTNYVYSYDLQQQLRFPLCPVCRSPFHKYYCLDSSFSSILESWTLPGYHCSTNSTIPNHQKTIQNHKQLGYATGGLELLTSTLSSSDSSVTAHTMVTSIRTRIVNTKSSCGKFDWVKNLNDLIEAYEFLLPYWSTYLVKQKCELLKMIHVDPVAEEEALKHTAAGKQKTVLQELAMKRERERFEKEHQDAKSRMTKNAKKESVNTVVAGKKNSRM